MQATQQVITASDIISKLWKFAHKRPRLEFGNYGNLVAYRQEVRHITKQLHDARAILNACERVGVSAECFELAMQTDRLKIHDGEVDFCACQYWPTEYRLAVARVSMSALWDHFRAAGCQTREEIRGCASMYIPRATVRRCFN